MLECLVEDTLHCMVSFLDTPNILPLAVINRRFEQTARSDSIWMSKAKTCSRFCRYEKPLQEDDCCKGAFQFYLSRMKMDKQTRCLLYQLCKRESRTDAVQSLLHLGSNALDESLRIATSVRENITARYYAGMVVRRLSDKEACKQWVKLLGKDVKQCPSCEVKRLVDGALIVSRWAEPEANIDAVRKQLYELGERAASLFAESELEFETSTTHSDVEMDGNKGKSTLSSHRYAVLRAVRAVNKVLFAEFGLSPDPYCRPNALSLHSVILGNRRGLPISLCLVWAFVASHIGLVCHLLAGMPLRVMLRVPICQHKVSLCQHCSKQHQWSVAFAKSRARTRDHVRGQDYTRKMGWAAQARIQVHTLFGTGQVLNVRPDGTAVATLNNSRVKMFLPNSESHKFSVAPKDDSNIDFFIDVYSRGSVMLKRDVASLLLGREDNEDEEVREQRNIGQRFRNARRRWNAITVQNRRWEWKEEFGRPSIDSAVHLILRLLRNLLLLHEHSHRPALVFGIADQILTVAQQSILNNERKSQNLIGSAVEEGASASYKKLELQLRWLRLSYKSQKDRIEGMSFAAHCLYDFSDVATDVQALTGACKKKEVPFTVQDVKRVEEAVKRASAQHTWKVTSNPCLQNRYFSVNQPVSRRRNNATRQAIRFRVGESVLVLGENQNNSTRNFDYRGVVVGWNEKYELPDDWTKQLGLSAKSLTRGAMQPFYWVLPCKEVRRGARIRSNSLGASLAEHQRRRQSHHYRRRPRSRSIGSDLASSKIVWSSSAGAPPQYVPEERVVTACTIRCDVNAAHSLALNPESEASAVLTGCRWNKQINGKRCKLVRVLPSGRIEVQVMLANSASSCSSEDEVFEGGLLVPVKPRNLCDLRCKDVWHSDALEHSELGKFFYKVAEGGRYIPNADLQDAYPDG
eukprot:g745.t1